MKPTDRLAIVLVECPTCPARPGEPCTGSYGKKIQGAHIARRIQLRSWKQANWKKYRVLLSQAKAIDFRSAVNRAIDAGHLRVEVLA